MLNENAFRNCYSLRSFILPNGVTYIGDNAFLNCDELTTFRNEYDFSYTEDDPHAEAIRVGFKPRDYEINNNGTITRGVYYTCETYLRISYENVEHAHTYLSINGDRDNMILLDPTSSTYMLNVNGYDHLNINIFNERYFDSDNSILRVEEVNDIRMNRGETSSFTLNSSIIEDDVLYQNEESVVYYLDGNTSWIIPSIEGNELIINLRENVDSGETGYLFIYAEYVGEYTNYVYLRSSRITVNVTVN